MSKLSVPQSTPTSRQSVTHVRYVITPDNLAYITNLATGRKIVVSANFFRESAGLHPRTVLGSAALTDAQLDTIGFRLVQRPTPYKKAVISDDARTRQLA